MSSFYLVGGAVRDIVLKIEPADYDFVVECNSFEDLIKQCKSEGFLPVQNAGSQSGYVEFPEHLGIKAICPKLKTVVDIHAARKEFDYRDRRHPAIVVPGTLEEDAARRDFTCNQLLLAREYLFDIDKKDKIVDFNNGLVDIEARKLETVGFALDRFCENPDRVIRALRFTCKYDFEFSVGIEAAFHNPELVELVRKENDDVKVKSLNKILKDKNLYLSLMAILCQYTKLSVAIFSNVKLEATNKK